LNPDRKEIEVAQVEPHAAAVDSWIARHLAHRPAFERLKLLHAAFEKVWGRARCTLGDVTLAVIVDRVLLEANAEFPDLSPIGVDSSGVPVAPSERNGFEADDERAFQRLRFVTIGFLCLLGSLTGEILTEALYAELDLVDQPRDSAVMTLRSTESTRRGDRRMDAAGSVKVRTGFPSSRRRHPSGIRPRASINPSWSAEQVTSLRTIVQLLSALDEKQQDICGVFAVASGIVPFDIAVLNLRQAERSETQCWSKAGMAERDVFEARQLAAYTYSALTRAEHVPGQSLCLASRTALSRVRSVTIPIALSPGAVMGTLQLSGTALAERDLVLADAFGALFAKAVSRAAELSAEVAARRATEQAAARLRQSLNTYDQLLEVISHDLRNFMGATLMWAACCESALDGECALLEQSLTAI